MLRILPDEYVADEGIACASNSEDDDVEDGQQEVSHGLERLKLQPIAVDIQEVFFGEETLALPHVDRIEHPESDPQQGTVQKSLVTGAGDITVIHHKSC